MSFVSTQPVPKHEDDVEVTNDGFFPPIHLKQLRNTQRLDGTVTTERLVSEAADAMASVNAELDAWRKKLVDLGYQRLADVDAVNGTVVGKINNESVLVLRYKRAIFCLAHACLIERYRNFDATSTGRKEDNSERPGIDELRRDARWAISDILGVARTTIDLI